MSLIKGGIHPPITHVRKDTMLRGKTQYPSKLALWKKDLEFYKQNSTYSTPKSMHSTKLQSIQST